MQGLEAVLTPTSQFCQETARSVLLIPPQGIWHADTRETPTALCDRQETTQAKDHPPETFIRRPGPCSFATGTWRVDLTLTRAFTHAFRGWLARFPAAGQGQHRCVHAPLSVENVGFPII
jgi:hypothetical protein